MKQIILEIGDTQFDVLQQYATGNRLTPVQYATNIVVGWINSHIQGFYIEKIREIPMSELEEKFGKVKVKNGGK